MPLNISLDANKALNDLKDEIRDAINNLDQDRFRDKDDTWLFFEGNNATQQIVGSIPRYDAQHELTVFDVNARHTSWFDNDEARSLLVQNAKAGDQLWVYDNPEGSQNDDWGAITLKQDITYMVIATFEQSFENDLYRIVYHRKNGLDGKISRIRNHLPGGDIL